MVIKRVLLAFIFTTAAVFAAGFAVEGEKGFAALSIAAGFVWLLLELYDRRFLNSIFFIFFTILAVLGCLRSMSPLLLLAGLIAALAAWDLSRFLRRSANLAGVEDKAVFAKRHLRKLAFTLGAGLLVALLPVLITFRLSFVTIFFIVLLAMVVLRGVVLYVYRQNEKSGIS